MDDISQSNIDLLKSLPLYDGLSEDELREVISELRPVVIADGDSIMRQGEPPDGVYFIVRGEAEVVAKLPGGGEAPIALVGACSVLGELALITATPRSATVRARGQVDALFIDRRYFQAALAQFRQVAIKMARNLSKVLVQRLLQQQARIGDHIARQKEASYLTRLPARSEGNDGPGFQVRAFLPLLPCLRNLESDDLDRIAALSTVIQLGRGTAIQENGATGAWLVVRGAVMSYLPYGELVHQLNFFGPGRFVAIGQLIVQQHSPVCYVARESATLMSIPPAAFYTLFEGSDPLSFRFVGAVNEHLSQEVRREKNHLTRLVGLARLRSLGTIDAAVTI
jgi:CRP/FNR family cyclic AMP-dependent transcriptional regulator